MPRYERSVRVAAPLDEVWTFHSTTAGLEALTPDWMNLEVEGVTGPDGEPDPEVLEVGARIDVSARPFGVGPTQSWTSVIVEREEREGWASFRDVMERGPFPEWVHTHRFFGDGDVTLVVDRVDYRFPVVGGALGPLGELGFEPMFRYRHRKTRELLEG